MCLKKLHSFVCLKLLPAGRGGLQLPSGYTELQVEEQEEQGVHRHLLAGVQPVGVEVEECLAGGELLGTEVGPALLEEAGGEAEAEVEKHAARRPLLRQPQQETVPHSPHILHHRYNWYSETDEIQLQLQFYSYVRKLVFIVSIQTFANTKRNTRPAIE